MERDPGSSAVEEFELAFARLEWVQAAAGCLHLPLQREALQWHLACCETARCALDSHADG
jgi:hypothetical protein